jgi:hypothetical protein
VSTPVTLGLVPDMHTLRPPAPSLPLLTTTMAETARLVVLLPVQPAVATASTAPADNWSLLHEDKMEARHGSGPEQGGTFARG